MDLHEKDAGNMLEAQEAFMQQFPMYESTVLRHMLEKMM